MADQENKVRYGLSHLTIFFEKDDGWDEPISIPGVVQCTHSAQVNSNDFYADNMLYWHGSADTGDEITVTTALFPDAVLARMLGWVVDSKGALVRVADGTPEDFAMAYQVEGDKTSRAKVCYSCSASIPNDTAETKGENINPQTEEMTIRSKAKILAGHETISTVLNEATDPQAFAGFFKSVYVPTYEDAGGTPETPTV